MKKMQELCKRDSKFRKRRNTTSAYEEKRKLKGVGRKEGKVG